MIIHTDEDRQAFFKRAGDIDLSKQAWVLSAEPFKQTRSNAQNALLNAWYMEIAKHTHEGFKFVRGQYKWLGGVPILQARGEIEFDTLITALKQTMQHEQIIDLFGGDKIAVSSVMKVGEFTDYLKYIEQDCATRQIPLIQHEDFYNQAMGHQ